MGLRRSMAATGLGITFGSDAHRALTLLVWLPFRQRSFLGDIRMRSIHSILVATDLSVDASHAVRRAALLAYAHGSRLHILHVIDTAGFKPLGPGSLP